MTDARALRQRVAREMAIRLGTLWGGASIRHEELHDLADLAIDLVLEEAAKVATIVGATTPEANIWQGAYKSASAIRALKEKQ